MWKAKRQGLLVDKSLVSQGRLGVWHRGNLGGINIWAVREQPIFWE